MPGRVAGRTGRSSKATAGNVDGNLPVRSRRSAKAVQIPDEGADSFLRTQLCHIFGEAQRSPVPHRKLAINLRKIQKACCYEPSSAKHRIRQLEEFGEEDFNNEIGRCLLRVLPVKKSERVGDRVVRFLGIFLQRASEEGA
jgi:condensin complex subunit 3